MIINKNDVHRVHSIIVKSYPWVSVNFGLNFTHVWKTCLRCANGISHAVLLSNLLPIQMETASMGQTNGIMGAFWRFKKMLIIGINMSGQCHSEVPNYCLPIYRIINEYLI